MVKIEGIIKLLTAAAAALAARLFGGIDAALGILLCFITFDYITGILSAIVQKELSSEIGYRGILKKAGILVIVAVAYLIGLYIGFEVRSWVIGYYIANESLSILENLGRVGVPYPERLVEVLKQLKKESDSDESIS